MLSKKLGKLSPRQTKN